MADLPLSQTQATSEERALSDLAQKCSDISQSLLAILNGLKVDSKSQFRTWKSLKASLRSGRKGEVIKSLQTKLHQITPPTGGRPRNLQQRPRIKPSGGRPIGLAAPPVAFGQDIESLDRRRKRDGEVDVAARDMKSETIRDQRDCRSAPETRAPASWWSDAPLRTRDRAG